MDQTFFGSTIFLDHKVFGPKIFWPGFFGPNFFSTKTTTTITITTTLLGFETIEINLVYVFISVFRKKKLLKICFSVPEIFHKYKKSISFRRSVVFLKTTPTKKTTTTTSTVNSLVCLFAKLSASYAWS